MLSKTLPKSFFSSFVKDKFIQNSFALGRSATNTQKPIHEVRRDSFRDMISEDSDRFQPESGRYHLYVGHGCPFAHRTTIMRVLKGLEEHISLSVVHPTMQRTKPEVDNHAGYVFRKEDDPPLQSVAGFGLVPCKGCIPDTVNNCRTVRELYEMVGGTGRFSIPILWDKKLKTMVNNESADIVRMFNSAFNKFSKNPELDLYPQELRSKIDEVTAWVQDSVVLGLYKVANATTQEAYEPAVNNFFAGLDRIEDVLNNNRYLCGSRFTEIDIKLFVTLVRFDEAYYVYYKCNKKRIVDYPNILNFCREIYQMSGIADTVNMDHIKASYFTSAGNLNYYSIIPVGPNFEASLREKHDRNRFNKPFEN